MGSINSLIRAGIKSLKPYSSARDEFEGESAVFLDANENPFFGPLNRYPDPRQRQLKKVISELKSIPVENIFTGNGSDEAIDLLIRAFCEPGVDNIVSPDPSYGMYEVSSAINTVDFRKVRLNNDFSLNTKAIRKVADKNTKIIFLCSPNNPTGNSFGRSEVLSILDWFEGLLVIDEAYLDFSEKPGYSLDVLAKQNLVVLQTLSKAWGKAGIRLGMAFACKEIIEVLNKIKSPYNINALTIEEAVRTLHDHQEKERRVQEIIRIRHQVREKLSEMPSIKTIYPSDANFLLVKVDNALEMYNYLANRNIIVRNRSGATGCENCLRITIGSKIEMEMLTDAIGNYEKEHKL